MEKERKMFFAHVESMTQPQREVYDAVVDELNKIIRCRKISGLQGLIEILVKRNILNHDIYFEIDDTTIGTKQVQDMYLDLFGKNKIPTRATIVRNARQYGLGVKVGHGFKHSKKKWERFLKSVSEYRRVL